MEGLSGKVAVVTGTSKGIGAAIARRLAGAGASVVVNYASDAAGAQMIARTPLGRLSQPAAIATIVEFLSSPASGWRTGEFLLASGGYR